MPMGFVRSHAECEYRFLRAIWDNTPAQPDFEDGVAVQRIMAAAELSAAERRWVSGRELHD
jgi:predicted dehydrogenase